MTVASLINVWRPFLVLLWAALSQKTSQAPQNCVWTEPFRVSLLWLRGFITWYQGTIAHILTAMFFFGSSTGVVTTTDASPWGIWGRLRVNANTVAYCSDMEGKFEKDRGTRFPLKRDRLEQKSNVAYVRTPLRRVKRASEKAIRRAPKYSKADITVSLPRRMSVQSELNAFFERSANK